MLTVNNIVDTQKRTVYHQQFPLSILPCNNCFYHLGLFESSIFMHMKSIFTNNYILYRENTYAYIYVCICNHIVYIVLYLLALDHNNFLCNQMFNTLVGEYIHQHLFGHSLIWVCFQCFNIIRNTTINSFVPEIFGAYLNIFRLNF